MAADAAHIPEYQPKAEIFISYSRKDMAFADKLEAALKAHGFEPLIDRTEIYAFEDWWKRIETLIGRADTVVFVLSPDAVASDVALKEVAYAASLKKRFAPIVCRRTDDDAVPEALRRLNFIFFDQPDRFDASADQLADALQMDIGWVRQHTEYGEAERRWSAAGQPGGLLLHSPTLEVAEYWISSRPRGAPELTAEIRTFIGASRQAADSIRRRQKRSRIFIYSLLVSIIIGLVGWINQSYIADEWRWYSIERPFVAANIWPYVLEQSGEHALRPGDSFRECTPKQQGTEYCPDMVVVPAGSFMMGSSANEEARYPDEGPQHLVTIAKRFAVSKYELTFDEWDTCIRYGGCVQHPADLGWGREQRPVIYVSWDDAQQYVKWLSKVTGRPYRLLTEAEYEYAARAGKTTVYPWGDDIKINGQAMANCSGCGSQWDHQTAPVGQFAANGFGLYDMAGNVWQWVEDCYNDSYEGAPADGSAWIDADCNHHVVRGGSWMEDPGGLRSALRGWHTTDARVIRVGFRVGRTLAP